MSVQNLIMAANGSVPANILKPHNCHEAVLGWVLQAKYPALRNVDSMSHGVEKAWLTLRSIAERYGGAFPKQLTGQWVAQNLYKGAVFKVSPPIRSSTLSAGDIVFMGTRNNPHHSMVVVKVADGQVLARGFNNAGAFGGPFMGWDKELRNLADKERWDLSGNFKANNGPCPLYVIRYEQVARNIPDDMNF
jgi:hypothetical protein